MKKALIVTTIQDTVESFLIPHIELLEKNGFEVWIATNIYRELPEKLKKNKWINISFKRNPFSICAFKAIGEMKELFHRNKFELVHFHTPVASFLGRYAANKKGQKNIFYTAHGFHFYRGAPIFNWLIYYPLEKIAAKWTDYLITINEEDFQIGKKILGNRGEVYKVDGVGLNLKEYRDGCRDRLRKELKIQEDEIAVTIIGELNSNKNQIQLIKALKILRDRGKKVKGIIVGDGEKRDSLKKVCGEKDILFLGFRKDIKDIIASSDILVSMSYREGLPRNIMEGMAQGKPFIVTDIRGNRDIIEDGVNGFLVPVGDEKITAKKIEELFNEELRERIGKNNIQSVEKFSIEKILHEMGMKYELL